MQIWWLVASLALSRTLAENCSFSEQCEEDAQVLIQQQSVQRSAAGTGVGVAVGAHISTLDGMRYPFSSHGTFELWGIRGVPSKALGGVELDPNTKRPVSVNWQLLAHYSGNAKITGVLLQDLSNPTDSLMQLTSEDCRWSKKLISPAEGSKEEAKWTSWPLDKMADPLSNGVTFVKLTNVVDRPKKHPEGFDRRISHVKLFLYTQEGSQIGRAELTDIKFYCRKGDQINAHINMHRKEDLKWVVGQIAPGKHSPDAHFIPDPWAALGGSNQASFFLRRADFKSGGLKLLQVDGCDEKDRSLAISACSKALEPLHMSEEDPDFKACVDDACGSGNPEQVAVETAEMLLD